MVNLINLRARLAPVVLPARPALLLPFVTLHATAMRMAIVTMGVLPFTPSEIIHENILLVAVNPHGRRRLMEIHDAILDTVSARPVDLLRLVPSHDLAVAMKLVMEGEFAHVGGLD